MRKICSVNECGRFAFGYGFCSLHYQRLRKRGLITPKQPNDAGHLSHGYLVHSTNGKHVYAHVAVAEKAFGRPLPKGVVVHHVNEDKLDNRPENLVICTIAYHRTLHRRMNALKACGNPSWRKCHMCGKYDDPSVLYLREKSFSTIHRACAATKAREFRQRRKGELRG